MQVSEGSPPRPLPKIGKMGPYTVFITPPISHSDSETNYAQTQKIDPPRVQPPPSQFEKLNPKSFGFSNLGFFWNTFTKVQNAHSSLDEHVARWLGLNQSKYQWALDDYYETKGVQLKEDGKVGSKAQSV